MVNLKIIIPIHTECADEFVKIEEFKKYSNRIKVLADVQEFKVE